MRVEGIDHIEFYVTDAGAAAARLAAGYGLEIIGAGGPETGLAGHRSVLVRQGDISIVCTSPAGPAHPAARYLEQQGGGPAVIAFAVCDAAACFTEAVRAGASPVTAPTSSSGVTCSAVTGFGGITHRFVARRNPHGPFSAGLPGLGSGRQDRAPAQLSSLPQRIDHVSIGVPAGHLARTARAYQDILGFTQTLEKPIATRCHALNSVVVQNPSGTVTLTLIEQHPATGRARPGGPGAGPATGAIEHIAFAVPDIAAAVRGCRARGVRFLPVPAEYYDELADRLGPGLAIEPLRDLGILADRDYWGQVLQVFAQAGRPSRPFFYELIERRGALTFGRDNIRFLYEAVERQHGSELPAAGRPTARLGGRA